ncbi:RE1, partial [Symbiodinium sp. CCMP2456]
MGVNDVFLSPTPGDDSIRDRPLLPHAAVAQRTPEASTGEMAQGNLLPSPLPTPMTHAARAAETPQSGLGLAFAQHGASAARWFTRLGEFVQRRVAQQSRPGLETTLVQETVWTPGGSARHVTPAQSETQPLFDAGQTRRLREMSLAAPQLYGSTAQRNGGSDSSASYTREQMELEVRRQVEQAMQGQQGLSEENQRLRRELETVRAQALQVLEVSQRERSVGRPEFVNAVREGGVSEGNPPPGLSVHNGGQEGLNGARLHGATDQGAQGEHRVQDDEQRPEAVLGSHGARREGFSERMGRAYGRGKAERARSHSEPRGYLADLLGRFGGSEGHEGNGGHGVSGGNPLGLPERVGDARGFLANQGAGQGDRESTWFASKERVASADRSYVSGGNPPGLSVHNRGQEGVFQNDVQHVQGMTGDQGISGGHTFPFPSDDVAGQAQQGPSPGVGGGLSDASHMDALLRGMAQLQAAMTMQLGMAATKSEAIRPGTSGAELPKLVEADEFAAINVGDWLHGLSGPMGDLTDGSSQWWSEMMVCLDQFYQQFVTSSAVKKLQLKAEDFMSKMLKEPRWHRVDKRAASMLLQAVPEAIKSELLANRLSSTLGILGRILTIYRPGSAAERQQVLKALEAPSASGSPVELVEVLRKWARWLKRAQDLGLQVPDASILLRGLDAATRGQLSQYHEVNFRTNILRFSLDLDAAPTLSNVTRFHHHLLGEFEQLAYRGRGKGGTAASAVIKNVAVTGGEAAGSSTPKGGSSPQAATSRPCKFYVSETGCQRSNCKFAHDWSAIPKEERAERCKGCGGKGHMRKNCPVKGAGQDGGRRGDEGKGGQPPKVRNAATTSGNKGSDGKRDDGTVPQSSSVTSSTPASSSLGASTDSSQGGGGLAAQGAGTSNKEMDDFLKNAAQVLKMMTDQQGQGGGGHPSMKMLKKVAAQYEAKMALVDSGATHPLRKATTSEWMEAPEVDVVVAGDATTRMRQNTSGTWLTQPTEDMAGSQTILPVGSLVSVLGYELRWSRRRCFLRAPDGKEIPLKVSSGCPEVDEAKALELIAEIEQGNVDRLNQSMKATQVAMLRACVVERDDQWERSLECYVQNGAFEDGFRALVSFPWARDLPREDLVKAVTDLPKDAAEAWSLMLQLGFNRRMRKRMMHKDWIVKLFSGARTPMDKMFKALESNGSMVLDVDIQRMTTLDLRTPGDGIMKLLLWGAATGRVAAVIGGVPRTSTRENLVRATVLVEIAKAGRCSMCKEADVPMDGVATALWASSEAEEDETSEVWTQPWFRRWVEVHSLDVLHFEQGGLGHSLRRPTVLVTNLDVSELRGVRDSRQSHDATSSSWAAWAPMLSRTLVQGLKRWKQRPGWLPRMMRALKAVDRKMWEKHLANDHIPYRADCLQCIHNSTGRPHRRCLHRDCYVLSADVLGPVRIAGPKGERHAIVFTYQFPKQSMVPEDQPIPEEELEGWSLDVAEPKLQELPPEDYDYEPSEVLDPELSKEELGELKEAQAEETHPVDMAEIHKLKAGKKDKESQDDWWEFREATGTLIRHHVAARRQLFRPTSWNGCPVHPAKLDPTRITEIQYEGGGVDMETSDWHGIQSGARKLDRMWKGQTTFRISPAEDPEEEEMLKKDEENWEKIIGDLTQPVELDTIYMVYPIRARRGGDAMLAIQEAVLRLKLWGYPVARLHTDRGSEFASKGLRKWLLDHDIYHTRSEALVPQTNGAAERGVRWFKTRAKVLLDEAKIPMKFWTLAMQHAANRRIYDRLGLQKPQLLPFGSEVMIKRKIYGNNKKYDLMDRWEKGKYLGLSDSIKGGSIVLRPSGVVTETLNLKMDVVDPHVLLSEPRETEMDDGGGVGPMNVEERPVLHLPEPDHRLRGKRPPPELRKLEAEDFQGRSVKPTGWTMRSMLRSQEDRAKYLYDMGKFDDESCARLLQEMDITGKTRTSSRGTGTSAAVLGAFVHGGMRGITLAARKRSWLTKYLNMVLRLRVAEDLSEDATWTTLGVFKAADIPPHKDLRNQPGTKNYATEVGSRVTHGLWVAKCNGDTGCQGGGKKLDYSKVMPDGGVVLGDIVKINGYAVSFDPRTMHSYVDKEKDRWILAGFTPLGVEKLKPEAVKQLLQMGFPLEGSSVPLDGVEGSDQSASMSSSEEESEGEEEDCVEYKAKVLRCGLEQQESLRGEGEHRDECALRMETLLEDFGNSIRRSERRRMKKIMKVSPAAAADVEVEQLLNELQGPLEVVHNVSLPEVKKYISRWTPAIQKEVQALLDSGTIKRLSPQEARELRQQGMIILPSKGVFTAKPPIETKEPDSGRFRRKCRIVVCGNYLPQSGTAVYASGTSADSFRLSVAYAVYKKWSAGSTDISNAFTLAPMPGDVLYGLQPPTVVGMADETQAGEVWLIQRVLYGLREAPRLWGLFRNNRFQNAKIPYGLETLVLSCMETDENVWIVRREGGREVQGMMLVYVDDLLFLSSPSIIQCLYDWLVGGWKCTALEKIENGFIRFLGMELRLWNDGWHISQTGYIRDLLRQNGMEESDKGLTVPCAREWLQDEDTDEDKPQQDEALVKMAQKATGETLWLSTRSRPELAHSVSCMASRALNQPQKALEIHKRVLQYLARTVDYGMNYYHDDSEPLLTVYSDASYAPGGGRSFGCIMAQLAGMPIAWRASKQPVITLSVAEAELYEGVSAVQLGLGVEAMLRELGEDPVMVLKIDNQAAQGLASEAAGSWKTRHLRIRARFLRQEVNAKRLHIAHVGGDYQKADIGTKAFDLPKFRTLMALWNMVPWSTHDATKMMVKTMSVVNNKRPLIFLLVCMMIIKSAGATKEDLALDGSLEFYAVTSFFVVAAVAVWELLKRMWATVYRWWDGAYYETLFFEHGIWIQYDFEVDINNNEYKVNGYADGPARHINDLTGAKVRLRGRGSGHWEDAVRK